MEPDRTDEMEEPELNETALRILNLLFILNSSSVPLTTEEIVSDSDVGYGSPNRASDLKKFKRDREKLAERGINVKEIRPAGAAQTEESLWTIDRSSTYAALGAISRDDADALLRAVDECLSRQDIPFRRALVDIRQRLAAMTSSAEAGDAVAGEQTTASPAADTLWSAFALHRRVRIAYVDARGLETQRVLAIWGIFMQHGHIYYVGLDDQSGQVRTFRGDRITRAWRPTGSYTVPARFNVRDYLFLPFDIGSGMATKVTFSLPIEIEATEVRALTKERGELVRDEQKKRWLWTIKAGDVDAAARFGLAHAQSGMRPVSPAKIVNAWNACIDKAVTLHG
ncbi:helix-turn-helix transcriptional regulator [Collinsella tanakaei]|uniref:helix-turn-helix transcriptional regulator n=1 Tax=Collinsella tanakaei TaxID=626935 RepID=UPI001959D3C2|nr:WYL domain-containing protein [Collinsella tanakaei]MBM6867702.1 WYL domain-containing protein [Collinsella tanakaei]